MNKIAYSDPSINTDDPAHKQILEAVSRIMENGNYVLGDYCKRLEEDLCRICACRYAVGVNSGTDALFLVLKALGIGEGDEVILPANVFHSVGNTVYNTGATPVFCDVLYDDMLIDPQSLEQLITDKTKAVIPVHLTGMPCDMDEISRIAETYRLYVIEDAAQAIGAQYKKQPVGALGVAGCFSFHPLKNIHAIGDGGAITTNDKELFERLLMYRNHGLTDAGVVGYPGMNSRLDEIHAAAISIQLKSLTEIVKKRRSTASYYSTKLHMPVRINSEPETKNGVYQLFMIKADRRNELAAVLAENGIETKIHYQHYLPFHPFYAHSQNKNLLPVTQKLSEEVLSLPIHGKLSDEQLAHITEAINRFYKTE